MNISREEQEQWDKAYQDGGNICFYPHEEIIRFVNKYVRKREGFDQFRNIMDLTEEEWKSFSSLDLGCGMGRHVKFLDEFGLNPVGIDLSDEAVNMGKKWFQAAGCSSLSDKLMVGSVTGLPYEDESFWLCVSHGVLDSMPRETAVKGMQEALRVLKSGGLMYFDLIMDTDCRDQDVIVDFGYEKGTVQSYFTIDSIHKIIGCCAKIVEFKIITWENFKRRGSSIISKRAHVIVEKSNRWSLKEQEIK